VVTTKATGPRHASAKAVPAAKKKPAARSGPAPRSRPAAKTARTKSARASEAERTSPWADHAADLSAIALVTVGILLSLAIYGAAAGAVGRGLDSGIGALVGWTRYLLPPGCIGAGVLILASRRRPDPLRTSVGALAVAVGVSGLAEEAAGNPRFSAAVGVLRGAGGWLGAGIGRPLADGIGLPGAVVVLVAVALAGVLLATGVTLRTAGRGLLAAVDAISRTLRRHEDRGGGAAPDPLPFEAASDTASDTDTYTDAATDAATGADPAILPGTGHGTGRDPAAQAADPAIEPEPTADPLLRDSAIAAIPETPTASGTLGTPPWRLPPMDLLTRSKSQRHDERELARAGQELVAALAAHGVETRLVGRTVGPTVTRYELELGPGVKVARVTSLSRDIAYAMASPDVRILAPIPGKSAIGVEVPNRRRQLVSLGDILNSDEARRAVHPLEVALGRDIAGRAVMVNLADMPHVLISGATGAGKSSCINSLITSILMRARPDEVRLILIDPKRVELGQYNDLPHLLTQVVVDPKKAANALSWAVKEMERRYNILAEHGMRDITGYNEAFDRGEIARPESTRTQAASTDGIIDEAADPPQETGPERLPFVLVVVDELNDLMMVAARDVEESVCRIAQMARAVGIHLVLATQRPSVDVITGVIKANIPSRMAFSVSSLADSRVILDQPGAERLIGKGDMLLLTASSSIPRRIQGPWVSEAEVRAVVAHWRRLGGRSEPAVGIDGIDDGPTGSGSLGGADDDELLGKAIELVVQHQLGSTSMLQRRLRVGFARAGRLMDLMERRGVVGPSEGSKARAVLMTPEELDSGGLR